MSQGSSLQQPSSVPTPARGLSTSAPTPPGAMRPGTAPRGVPVAGRAGASGAGSSVPRGSVSGGVAAGSPAQGSPAQRRAALAAPSGEDQQAAPAGMRRGTRRIGGLDGLRAIAVLLVLIYHLLPGALPGGVVGVDAFFVISGFLITSLLLTERRTTGKVDLRRFFQRRLRRIVPALIVAVVVVVSLAACLDGDVLLGVRRQVIGAVALVYNWVEIGAGSSYFDQAQPLLLTNVWSLAVEEQFYVVWPLLLLALLGRGTSDLRRRVAALGALALAVISAGLALVLTAHGASASRVYMGTDTHAFGLMLGAALALWHGHATDAGDERRAPAALAAARGALGWVGLVALIICSRVGTDGSMVTGNPLAPTLWLVAGSVCTLAVVQSLTEEVSAQAGPAWALRKVLSWRGLEWLGARSYGLYLWHWPLWVLAFYAFPPSWDPRLTAALVCLASVAAAALSYAVLEDPIRRVGVRGLLREVMDAGPRKAFALSGVMTSIVLLVIIAFVAQPRQSSAEQAINKGAAALASAPAAAASTAPASPAPTTAAPSPTPTPVSGDQVSIVGDSVTLASAQGLQEALPGVAIDAKVSRSVYVGLEVLKGMDAQYGPRHYVVVALATNGTVPTDQLQSFLDYIGPDRQMVLVTGFGPARTTWIPGDNQVIADFAAAHPDQVAVADWHGAIEPHQDLLAQDLVHPGPEGGRIYAQVVKDALDSLPQHKPGK